MFYFNTFYSQIWLHSLSKIEKENPGIRQFHWKWKSLTWSIMNLTCAHSSWTSRWRIKKTLNTCWYTKSWVYNMCEGKFWKAPPPAIFSLFYAHCSYHNLVSIRWDLKVAGNKVDDDDDGGIVKKEGSKVTDNNLGTWMLEEAKGITLALCDARKHNKVFFSIRFYVCSGFQTKMWEGTLHEFYETSSLMGFFFFFFWHTRRNSLLRKSNHKGRCLLIFFT